MSLAENLTALWEALKKANKSLNGTYNFKEVHQIKDQTHCDTFDPPLRAENRTDNRFQGDSPYFYVKAAYKWQL